MKGILTEVVKEATNSCNISENDVILDIGGNDGTLLNLLNANVKAKVNIDAASNIVQIPNSPNYTYINSKFNKEVYLSLDLPAPKLIFSVAVFYQLEDPLKFCNDLKDIMNSESILVLQMTYLESMLQNNIFDNIVHEHTAYYSLFSLKNLLSRVGLQVIGARITSSYGGSLRVYINRIDSDVNIDKYKFELDEVVQLEEANRTNSFEALFAFNSRFYFWKKTLRSIIDYQFEIDGPIIGLGASTKGNMILQSLDITSEIMPYILDNNVKKIGSKTTGSGIQILDENSITQFPRNIFMLPYYYKDFFVGLLKSRIGPNNYVNMIDPLPVPKISRIRGDANE
jgi:NDP-4-keto-2,6-dideoxyhexose 3-C-methyltransferase